MLTLIFIITLVYLALIGSFAYGFDKVHEHSLQEEEPVTKFSVIIPFRNEAQHLKHLIDSMANLNYPKSHFELLLINDESDDGSAEIISGLKKKYSALNLTIINNQRLTRSPKKDAITLGNKLAKYEWIVTSDADCVMPKYWLDVYDSYVRRYQPNLMTGPVVFNNGNRFIERFQILDLLSLQGATMGSFGIGKPFMCNGANIAYSKSFFEQVNGYEGNSNMASGDDVFLLEKALKLNKNQVHYIKNNLITVRTSAETSFNALVAQRVRWASKTANYNSIFGKLTGLVVILMNTLLLLLPLFFLIGFISLKSLAYTFLIKTLIDFLLIYKSARFLEQEHVLISYLSSCFLYPIFCTYVAILSVFTDYKWKGRKYSK